MFAALAMFAALTMGEPFWCMTNAPAAHALGAQSVLGSGMEAGTRLTKDTDLSFWGTYSAVGERFSGTQYSVFGGRFPWCGLTQAWEADAVRLGMPVRGEMVAITGNTSRVISPQWRSVAVGDIANSIYSSYSQSSDGFWTRFAAWTLPHADAMPTFDWTTNPHSDLAANSNRWACLTLFPEDGILRKDYVDAKYEPFYNSFPNGNLEYNPINGADGYGLWAFNAPTNTVLDALAAYMDGVYGGNSSNRWDAARVTDALTNATTRLAADSWRVLNNAIGWADVLYGTAEYCVLATEDETNFTRMYTLPAQVTATLTPIGYDDEGLTRYHCGMTLGWGGTEQYLATNAVARHTIVDDTVFAAYEESNGEKGIKAFAWGNDKMVVTAADVATIFNAWTQEDQYGGFDHDGEWVRMTADAVGDGLHVQFQLLQGGFPIGWPFEVETNATFNAQGIASRIQAYGHASKRARRLTLDGFRTNDGDILGSQETPVETNAWNAARIAAVTDVHAVDTRLDCWTKNANPFGQFEHYDAGHQNEGRRFFDIGGWHGYYSTGIEWQMRMEEVGAASSRDALMAAILGRQVANNADARQRAADLARGWGADILTDDGIATVASEDLAEVRSVDGLEFDCTIGAAVITPFAAWMKVDGQWKAVADDSGVGSYVVTNIIPRQVVTHTEEALTDYADWEEVTVTPPESCCIVEGTFVDTYPTNSVAPAVTNHVTYTAGGQDFEETIIVNGDVADYYKWYFVDGSERNDFYTNASYTATLPRVVEKHVEQIFAAETNLYTLATNAYLHEEVYFENITITNSVPTVTNTYDFATNVCEVYVDFSEPYTYEFDEPYIVRYTKEIERTVTVDGVEYTVPVTVEGASNAWRKVTVEEPGGTTYTTNNTLVATVTNFVTRGTQWTYERPEAKFRTVYHNVDGLYRDSVEVGGLSFSFSTNMAFKAEACPPVGSIIKSSYPCRFRWQFRNLFNPAEFYPTGAAKKEDEERSE